MIKLEMGGDPINLILGQLGPWQTQIGPNGSAHSDTGVSNLLQSDYMSLDYDLVSFSVNNDAS